MSILRPDLPKATKTEQKECRISVFLLLWHSTRQSFTTLWKLCWQATFGISMEADTLKFTQFLGVCSIHRIRNMPLKRRNLFLVAGSNLWDKDNLHNHGCSNYEEINWQAQFLSGDRAAYYIRKSDSLDFYQIVRNRVALVKGKGEKGRFLTTPSREPSESTCSRSGEPDSEFYR